MGKIVAEYVASLPEDSRAPEEIYRRRLAACEHCASLENGMCRECVCYVEARAAKAGLKCPGVPSRWNSVQIGEEYRDAENG